MTLQEHAAVIRERMDLPNNAALLLHVGRLDMDKSVDRVIRAAAEVIHRTDAHLVVVGDGQQKSSLIRLCKSLGVENRVHFPGYMSVEQGLADIYRTANVFLTASEIETQGIVLLEAMASGLPIVAVNATCIPEVIRDGRNGFLVKSGDIQGFADSILVLLNDPLLAMSMSRESVRAAALQDREGFLAQHEMVYTLMSEQGHPRSFSPPYGNMLKRLTARAVFRYTRLLGRLRTG